MNSQARAKLDSVDLYNDVAREERTWKVRMADGGTKAMTVDELDAAFDASEIGLTTLVQRPSGGEWRTLGEAAGVDDSIRPVSSDFEIVDIPKPPPLPRKLLAADDLTEDELSVIRRPRKSGRRFAAVAMLGLLVGAVVAWKYLPAKPIIALAKTTILAPPEHAAAAVEVTPATPLPPAPETLPAPEGNALTEQTIVGASVAKALKPAKTTGKSKKTKTTLKAHRKAKKHA